MGHQANVKWARRHLRAQVAAGVKLERELRAGPSECQVRERNEKRMAKLETDARRTAIWLGLCVPPLPPRMTREVR